MIAHQRSFLVNVNATLFLAQAAADVTLRTFLRHVSHLHIIRLHCTRPIKNLRPEGIKIKTKSNIGTTESKTSCKLLR